MLRDTTGREGDALIRFPLLWLFFLTPPSYGHLPYILCFKTQGRSVAIFIADG